MTKGSQRILNRILALGLAMVIAMPLSAAFLDTRSKALSGIGISGPKLLNLDQAKSLSIYNSSAIEGLDMKLDAKTASLKSAIKSIKVKKKNLSTIKWSPLLKFKWPSKPDFAEAFDFQFKPVQIQYEIDKLEHSKKDQELAETETVNNLFVDIWTYEKRIDFTNARMELLSDTIAKTQAKVLMGEASQKDLDNMQKSYDNLKSSLSGYESKVLNKKKKLSNKLKVDVTTGYKFQDPSVENEVTLDMKDILIQYTMDRDDTYYEACVSETEARQAVEVSYNLLKNKYSKKYMNIISPYVDAILRGDEINRREYQRKYQEFVEKINEKWKGKKKILFFKFPKVRQQGSLDGDHYIEDDPMALLTYTSEFMSAVSDRQQALADLKTAVEDALTQYIDVRNAYRTSIANIDKAGKDLEKATIANKSGLLDYNSYKTMSDEFDDMEMDLVETQQLYSETLYTLDRTTCGALTDYFKDLTVDLSQAPGGESYVDIDYADGATYYIQPIIQQTQFQMGIDIPDGFDVNTTDFELWINGTQIGDRTPNNKVIRHMQFDLSDTEDVFIRLYNNDEFVDDVRIDAGVYNGPLKIMKDINVIEKQRQIARYEIIESDDWRPTQIKIEMTAPESVAYFRIKDSKGDYLLSGTMRDINSEFIYHDFIRRSIQDLIFEFYDEGENLVLTGRAEPATRTIVQEEKEM